LKTRSHDFCHRHIAIGKGAIYKFGVGQISIGKNTIGKSAVFVFSFWERRL
jgi:hypothetical protein